MQTTVFLNPVSAETGASSSSRATEDSVFFLFPCDYTECERDEVIQNGFPVQFSHSLPIFLSIKSSPQLLFETLVKVNMQGRSSEGTFHQLEGTWAHKQMQCLANDL